MRKSSKTVAERFWEKVNKQEGENTCWIWTGAIDKRPNKGYGFFNAKIDGKFVVSAHRASWFLKYGATDLHILHKCDNPPCINPDHLYAGTHQDNMNDRQERDRTARNERHWCNTNPEKVKRGDDHYARQKPEVLARGEKHGCAKLNAEKVLQIRSLYASNSARGALTRLSKQFEISTSNVFDIVNKKIWTHI